MREREKIEVFYIKYITILIGQRRSPNQAQYRPSFNLKLGTLRGVKLKGIRVGTYLKGL